MKLYYYVDHTSRYVSCSGVQRVVRGLARALLEMGHELVFVAWSPVRKALVPIDQSMLRNLGKFDGPFLKEEIARLYLKRIEDAEALHQGTFHPLAGDWLLVPEVTHITFHDEDPACRIMDYCACHFIRTAFVFYDAIPLKHPEYAQAENKHTEYMQQLALANLIIPISKFSADDLASFYLNRLYFQNETLPNIAPVLLPSEVIGQERREPIDSCDQPELILSVGTIEPRKNQLGLLHAFQLFCEKYPEHKAQLVLIGGLHPLVAREIHEAVQKNPKVKLLEYVDDKLLHEYYERCDFTVFPSIEEGYGLPIVESLWNGKPCICANFGSMGEIAEGGGCLRIDTRSVDELNKAISRLLLEPAALNDLKAEIKERKFTRWLDYGLQVSKLINKEDEPSTHIKKIYYWVDHTSTYPSNSGIQRVVRGLARILQQSDHIAMVPVKWNSDIKGFVLPSLSELGHLGKWNGPAANLWMNDLPSEDEIGAWLVVPELLTYEDAPDIREIITYTRKRNIQSAVIFYDAIPYKMENIYPQDAQQAHALYMSLLPLFDRVLSISEQSRTDLVNFVREKFDRLVNVEQKLRTILLPAEFPETARQISIPDIKAEEAVKILSVGTLEPRKNHLVLLEAFTRAKRLTNVSLKLILAGQAPFQDIANVVREYCAKDKDIIWIDSPNDKSLGELYNDCSFTVYPSLEEGFGLPILESLWYGRPCICRNASSMQEIGEGGGCVMVETADPDILSQSIASLAESRQLLRDLTQEALQRNFKTWNDYGQDVLKELANSSGWHVKNYPMDNVAPSRSQFHAPVLSICISTYNRAQWLSLSLPLLLKQTKHYRDVIEIIVCDNASTDETPKIVKPYLDEPSFRYFRNPENVGMLGNLKVTAQHAQGQYVWILGDDDLLRYGTIERVLKAILEHPEVGLVYLNYAYTNIADAKQVENVEQFLESGIPIRKPYPDLFAPIATLSTLSENFFTAIYCLIFRRDHALYAYSQNTNGRPFSTMPTCIPTSYYVCNHMMEEAGYWIGEPGPVVNMNVSWGKYAPLWVLERLPELYDLAELKGANPIEVDHWRSNNLPGAIGALEQIYFSDTENNIQYFSMERFIVRHKHLPIFKSKLQEIMSIYEKAHENKRYGALVEPAIMRAQFGL